MCSFSRPLAARFSQRFARDSTLASLWDLWESATKTMPSAPESTALRVALYWTWPGTV